MPVDHEVRDLVAGLWVWRCAHPHWQPGQAAVLGSSPAAALAGAFRRLARLGALTGGLVRSCQPARR